MKKVALVILLMFCLGWKNPFINKIKKGNQLYQKQEYDQALQAYLEAQLDDPESEIIHFNIGNVLYKQGKYEEAKEEFTKALQSKDASIQAKACYNIAACCIKTNDLPGAIEYYQKALKYNPEDQEAKNNLEIARKKLKEMAQQQQQQQQQQQAQNSTGDKKEKSSSKGQKNEKGNDQLDPNSPGNQQQGISQEKKEQGRVADSQKEKKEMSDLEKGEQGEKSTQPDPNQQAICLKPGGDQKNPQGEKMSKEDAIRILQALESREMREPQAQRQQVEGEREHIQYDW